MSNDLSQDLSNDLRQQVENAIENKTPLCITAGGSKAFYGNNVDGQALDVSKHQGITEYQPSELVVTVRSGTLLSELEAELKANKQILAFEPPQHTANTTIGGAIACGLSGPRRMACGSARDFVLGCTIINGKAEQLRFGGQVMKNVAGYDASRLMVGAQGTLGLLLDVSLKVLPMSETEVTLQLKTELSTAIKHIQQWLKQGLPISASCYTNHTLNIRLSSTHSAVSTSVSTIKKLFDCDAIDNNFWLGIKNQNHDFFSENNLNNNQQLWRCSHQTNTPFYGVDEDNNQLIEWHGALRWVKSSEDLYSAADTHSGHACLYPINQGESFTDIFQPLAKPLMKIQQRMKLAFDPDNILNAGRLYTDA